MVGFARVASPLSTGGTWDGSCLMSRQTGTRASSGYEPIQVVAAAGVVGGVAAGIWIARKARTFAEASRPEGMIDWERAREVAVSMNRGDTLTSAQRIRLDSYYEDL